MEVDALGEMMNISLGSSATAVSNMLGQRVDITTPKVSVIKTEDFSLGNLEPAIGVEIRYVAGLEGSNIMLLKRSDIKVIVDLLMGMQTPDEEFELNELTISAVCELMNQMMGAASTALSDFFGFSVNISTPQPFQLDNLDQFKRDHFPQNTDTVVVVRFSLKIEDVLESEFMNVMSVELAKELLKGLGLGDALQEPAPEPAPAEPAASGSSGGVLSQEEIEKLLQQPQEPAAPAPAPAAQGSSGGVLSQEEIEKLLQQPQAPAAQAPAAPAPAPAAPAPSGGVLSQEEIEKMLQQPQQTGAAAPAGMPQQGMPGMPMQGQPAANGQMGYPPMYYPPYPYPYPMPPAGVTPDPKVINTQPVAMPTMDLGEQLGEEQAQNLDLIMEVPLQVTVEIGRTRQKVQDILEYSKGSLVVLDKLAGDQVDLFVNGKCIARGDVVVIDDNFGVRITEIVQNSGIEKVLQK